MLYCGAINNYSEKDAKGWISELSEISIISDTEVEIFYTRNTSDITPKEWIGLAMVIKESYELFDGFVILHGLDNILYTASALSFLIQNSPKPIVFTGGHLSHKANKKPYFGSAKEVGIKANIINAVQVATLDIPEVSLMFGNRLLRANQARRINDSSLNIFDAPEGAVLGKIDFSIRMNEKNILRSKGKILFHKALENSVCWFHAGLSFDFSGLEGYLSSFRAIIFDFSFFETPPRNIEILIEKLINNAIVAVRMKPHADFSQCKENVINISNVTPEAGLVKLMWVLTQGKNNREIKKLMDKNIAGENL